ncbi:MAG: hypothetical protein ACOY3Y_03925, partial [Acidobacteriota bacterium]
MRKLVLGMLLLALAATPVLAQSDSDTVLVTAAVTGVINFDIAAGAVDFQAVDAACVSALNGKTCAAGDGFATWEYDNATTWTLDIAPRRAAQIETGASSVSGGSLVLGDLDVRIEAATVGGVGTGTSQGWVDIAASGNDVYTGMANVGAGTNHRAT